MESAPDLTGRKVRELRIAAGLSQIQLAEAAGLSRGIIQLIERGGLISSRSRRLLSAALMGATPLDAGQRLARLEDEVARLRETLDRVSSREQAVA